MKRGYFILLMLLLGLFGGVKAQSLHGLWKDAFWDPMDSYYYFDTIDSTFKSYYLDDLYGTFGKGHFQVMKNRINLQYDSIICDKPIIELLDDDLMNDTTYIAFFQYWGFPKRIDILENKTILYSNWTSDSDSIMEDYLFIKIPKRLDSLEIAIYNSYGSSFKEITRFNIRLFQKPYCNLYYYPSASWYKYEKQTIKELKFKLKGNDLFIGGNKFGFKKVK